MRSLVVVWGVALTAVATLGGAGSAARGTAAKSFRPAADAHVTAAQKRKNFGRSRTLVAGGKARSVAYLRFDLRAVDATLGRTKLRLFARTASAARVTLREAAPADWSERGVTFENRPSAGRIVASGRPRRGWLTFDVTSAASRTYVLSLALNAQSGRVAFASREDRGHAPRLVVTAKPVAPQTLIAAGDIAGCDTNGDEQTAALVAQIPGTVAALGDLVYETGNALEFANCYDPTWGKFKTRTRPAVGNHEYNTPGAGPYYNYFGAVAGEPGKGYYSYDLGRWHVVVLNSNCLNVSCEGGSAQEQWLRADLGAHRSFCTLAYWHHPRFSSGPIGDDTMTDDLWSALYANGADVILVAHDHEYERFAPQRPDQKPSPTRGIRQFVVGTGGRSHHAFTHVSANSEVRDDTTFGVLKLELHAARYAWQFVPVAGQSFTDSGTALCH
ncbi:MAG: DNRLRE domain-containing protein [Actinomycetota bacterium]|nr:DNRLRE domain-containing protein [Actinomycetota bacterium]